MTTQTLGNSDTGLSLTVCKTSISQTKVIDKVLSYYSEQC